MKLFKSFIRKFLNHFNNFSHFLALIGLVIVLTTGFMVGLIFAPKSLASSDNSPNKQYAVIQCQTEQKSNCFVDQDRKKTRDLVRFWILFYGYDIQKLNDNQHLYDIHEIYYNQELNGYRIIFRTPVLKTNQTKMIQNFSKTFAQTDPPQLNFFTGSNLVWNRWNYQNLLFFIFILFFGMFTVCMIGLFGKWGALAILFNAAVITGTLAIWNSWPLVYSSYNLQLLFVGWLLLGYLQFYTLQKMQHFFIRNHFWTNLRINITFFKNIALLFLVLFLMTITYFLINYTSAKQNQIFILSSLKINFIGNNLFVIATPLILLFLILFITYYCCYQPLMFVVWFLETKQQHSMIVKKSLTVKHSQLLALKPNTKPSTIFNYWTSFWLLFMLIGTIVFIAVFATNFQPRQILDKTTFTIIDYNQANPGDLINYFNKNYISYAATENNTQFIVSNLTTSNFNWLEIQKIDSKTLNSVPIDIVRSIKVYWLSIVVILTIVLAFSLVIFGILKTIQLFIMVNLQFFLLALLPFLLFSFIRPLIDFGINENLLFLYLLIFFWTLISQTWALQTQPVALTIVFQDLSKWTFYYFCSNFWIVGFLLLCYSALFNVFLNHLIFVIILLGWSYLVFWIIELPCLAFLNWIFQRHLVQKWQIFFKTAKANPQIEKEIIGIND